MKASIISLLAVLALSFGQTTAPGLMKAPIEFIEGPVAAGPTGAVVPLYVSSKSPKNILAYVLCAEFFDGSGRKMGLATKTSNKAIGSPSAVRYFGAQTSWQDDFEIPASGDGRAVSHKISVDFVLFQDGSRWGPDTTKTSLKIEGVIQGYKLERARLRRIAQTHGVKALLDDLNSPAN
jgi:hypothetical protein